MTIMEMIYGPSPLVQILIARRGANDNKYTLLYLTLFENKTSIGPVS